MTHLALFPSMVNRYVRLLSSGWRRCQHDRNLFPDGPEAGVPVMRSAIPALMIRNGSVKSSEPQFNEATE